MNPAIRANGNSKHKLGYDLDYIIFTRKTDLYDVSNGTGDDVDIKYDSSGDVIRDNRDNHNNRIINNKVDLSNQISIDSSGNVLLYQSSFVLPKGVTKLKVTCIGAGGGGGYVYAEGLYNFASNYKDKANIVWSNPDGWNTIRSSFTATDIFGIGGGDSLFGKDTDSYFVCGKGGPSPTGIEFNIAYIDYEINENYAERRFTATINNINKCQANSNTSKGVLNLSYGDYLSCRAGANYIIRTNEKVYGNIYTIIKNLSESSNIQYYPYGTTNKSCASNPTIYGQEDGVVLGIGWGGEGDTDGNASGGYRNVIAGAAGNIITKVVNVNGARSIPITVGYHGYGIISHDTTWLIGTDPSNKHGEDSCVGGDGAVIIEWGDYIESQR